MTDTPLRERVTSLIREGGVIYGIPEDMADAAIALIRREALEEAARVAEGHKSRGSSLDFHYPKPSEIAAAIRAMMKEEE